MPLFIVWYLLQAGTILAYTHADTLRGSNGRGRVWWDLQHYDLTVQFFPDGYIVGENKIHFTITSVPCDSLQLDLDTTMHIVRMQLETGENLDVSTEGKVVWVKYPFHTFSAGSQHEITVNYSGTPRKAVNPPWDGGFSQLKDKNGKPWLSVSCQGLGASVWWPCKDMQWDEPDSGIDLHFALRGFKEMKDSLAIVSNGRFLGVDTRDVEQNSSAPSENLKFWHWQVKNPINNYDVTFYIGDYVHWHDTLTGEKGLLDLDFWALRYNEVKARIQFAVVKQMVHCFEYWMGPYPFYEDGYKLVEAPYLGMEHQSAIAYGNDYKMGYMGFDRTYTGVGMNFDYIIVHESGHEWFGNNITAKDIADNWIHEGITTYSETLFTECMLGKEKADQYNVGEWRNIENDKPIIGTYGVNTEGSNDMYDKGTAMMHMIRILTKDDEKFRQMLRGLTSEYYHKTVTTQEIESYIQDHTGVELKAFFNQYLRSNVVPEVEYYIADRKLHYRFDNVVPGFSLPIPVASSNKHALLNITSDWQTISFKKSYNLKFSKDFLIKVK